VAYAARRAAQQKGLNKSFGHRITIACAPTFTRL